MSLETQIAGAVTEARKVFDLVAGQFGKWDGQVKAQIEKLEEFKNNFTGKYRLDFNVSQRARILQVIATPQVGNSSLRFDLFKMNTQEDWGFNQAFIKIRRTYFSPTSETVYRVDNYYNSCTLTLVVDGGCNILDIEDKGEIAQLANNRTMNQWIIFATLGKYSGYQIEMEFVKSLSVADYRNPLSDTSRGVTLLSNIKISE